MVLQRRRAMPPARPSANYRPVVREDGGHALRNKTRQMRMTVGKLRRTGAIGMMPDNQFVVPASASLLRRMGRVVSQSYINNVGRSTLMGIADKVLEQLKGLPPKRQRLVLELANTLAHDPLDDDDVFSPNEPFDADKVLEQLNQLPQKRQRLALELAQVLASDPDDDDDDDDEYSPDDPFEYNLCEYLQYCLEVRERHVADYLEAEGIDPVMLIGHATRCAESLFEATRHLGSTEHPLQHLKDTFLEEVRSETKDFLDDLSSEHPKLKSSPLLHTWYEFLNAVLARRVITMLEEAVDRFDDLSNEICALELTQRGRDFLAHVATCYMFGFDAECIIMCRAVLDVEFAANVPNDLCMSLRPPCRPGVRPSPIYLKERITTAHLRGLIDEETRDQAADVAREGNKVVHETPKPYESGLMDKDTRDVAARISDLEREVDDATHGTQKPTRNSLDLIIATLKVLEALPEDGLFNDLIDS
jgi:hypothetical protein